MKKYKVWLTVYASKYLGEIEAENLQEALYKSYEVFDCDDPSLCYHCAGNLEIGGSELQAEEQPAHSGDGGE